MWATNLKVAFIVLGTIAFYTLLANSIPQVESDVPDELVFAGEVTAEELVSAGEALFDGAGACAACHGLGTRAPNLRTDEGGTGLIGERCATRVPGQDCKTYLHESLVNPNDYVVAGYQPIMPDVRRTLSETQIWALVAYLQSLGGEVTVTAEDFAGTEGQGEAPGPAGVATAAGAPGGGVGDDPMEILRAFQCLVCHQLEGEGGPIGPPLDGLGARRSPEEIRRKILEPNADTTPGYENFAGTMPANFGEQMSAAQLEALTRFLASLR